MFKRIVAAVEVLAVAAFALMVVLLFVRQPADDTAPVSTSASAAPDGAQLYKARCASCHGANGEGGRGSQLNEGKVTKAFSDAASEVSFVKRGSGSMPAFERSLNEAEIQAVVDFTRTVLQSK